MLVTINSSINLFVYCGFGERFRNELKKMVRPLIRNIKTGQCCDGFTGRNSPSIGEDTHDRYLQRMATLAESQRNTRLGKAFKGFV